MGRVAVRQFYRGVLSAVVIGLMAWVGSRSVRVASAADQPGASYEAEKAKALANPYPNDFGPATIDVSSYPPEIQDTYNNLFLMRCSRCHQPSRPLNSQFLEPYGSREDKTRKLAEWQQKYPDIFKDRLVWQPEEHVWERYVKKMMAKPGCNIAPPEGKKIWQFLTYDSEHRKTGANAEKWAAHRRKLLTDFKASHPARYKELFEVQ